MIVKHFHLFISILAFSSCISRTQEKEEMISGKLTQMTFIREKHNFGHIKAGRGVVALFKFTNTGKSPLMIKDVSANCGCTVPEWDKGIITPNYKGEIKVLYDAKIPGRFKKTITVFYNGKDSPQLLTITGEVQSP